LAGMFDLGFTEFRVSLFGLLQVADHDLQDLLRAF
jgi:hypothetical protein